MTNQPSPEDDPFAQYKEVADQYHTFESRIAWDWLCGGNRHFGYYETDTWWPFPISAAQQRMQAKLLSRLDPLPPNAHLLDIGCGDGHVAIDVGQRRPDLRITAFDVVERHLANARRNVNRAGLSSRIDIVRLDFAGINTLPPDTYDGAYTSEALLHAENPLEVLSAIHRVLRPGGVLVLHEYHNDFMKNLPGFPQAIAADMDRSEGENQQPAFTRAERFFVREMVRAGFKEVEVRDYSERVEPMARLLSVSALWRYVVVALRLGRWFPNSARREEGYVGRVHWAYVSVRGVKGVEGK